MAGSLIEVQFGDARAAYRAGEELSGTVQVCAVEGDKVGEVEVSVLWYTEGKGNTDKGVVWFQSFPDTGEAERKIPFRAQLPLLPLTYHGELVKITWAVRVRQLGFLGNDTVSDTNFIVQ